jgi:DNA-binding NarL/FixJ family response regulator
VQRVVVVDDSADVRRMLRVNLELDRRHRVVGEARDGFEGMTVIERTKPDVAIIDIHMPGMGGIELIQHLRARTSSTTRLIAYSGDADGVAEAKRVGADAGVVASAGHAELLRVMGGDQS